MLCRFVRLQLFAKCISLRIWFEFDSERTSVQQNNIISKMGSIRQNLLTTLNIEVKDEKNAKKYLTNANDRYLNSLIHNEEERDGTDSNVGRFATGGKYADYLFADFGGLRQLVYRQ